MTLGIFMEGFRNFVKSWWGKSLLVLFSVPFVFLGIESSFTGSSAPTDGSRVVNGVLISKEEIDAEVNALKQTYLQIPYVNGDESLLNIELIEKTAIDNLVSRQLLLQQARELGISLNEEQIKQMIQGSAAFQDNGQFSQERYEHYLRQAKMTSEGFINNIRQNQALQILTNSLSAAMVSEKDISALLKLENEQRQIHLASIPLTEYIKEVSASEQDVQAYYDKHKNQFIQLAKVNAQYIVVSPSQINVTASAVSEEDLQAAYAQYLQTLPRKVKHILVTSDSRSDAEAQARANEAYAKLQAGESFASVAKAYSDDDSSKDKGGLLESYTAGEFSESFDQAVAAAQSGKATQPVKTNFGYQIILTESSNAASFESKKASLMVEVQKNKQHQAVADYINKLNESVASSDSLEIVQQEVKGTKVESVQNITALSKDAILGQAAVKTRLFDSAVKNGEYHATSSIQLANGDFVWVKATQYTPAGIQPLEQVAEQVKAKVIEEKAGALALAKIQTALDAFKTQPAQTVLAENNALRFQNAGLFTRTQNQRLIPKIQDLAFSLATPKDGQWSVGSIPLDNALWVVAVSSVKAMPEGDVAKAKETLAQFYVNQELSDYLAYLKSKAKIEGK